MVHIKIREFADVINKQNFLQTLNKIDCKIYMETLTDGTTEVLLIEDIVDTSMVSLYQRVSLQVMDNNLTNVTVVENYLNDHGEEITVSNYSEYIDTLSATVDKAALECFNLRDSIDLHEEDYTEDIEIELKELEAEKEAYGDLLVRMYEYSTKLNIEI